MRTISFKTTLIHFLWFMLGSGLVGITGVPLVGGSTGIREFLIQWLFFSVFSGSVLLVAGKVARHPDPNKFTSLMLGSVVLRITLCLVFIFVYTLLFKPADNSFLLWFFLLYAAFTGHEVLALSRMVTGPGSAAD